MAEGIWERYTGAEAAEAPFTERMLALFRQTLDVPTVAVESVSDAGSESERRLLTAPADEPDDGWKTVQTRALLPTLQRELRDMLLFLQLPAAWAAVSRAEPPFVTVEPPCPQPHGPPLPHPHAVERLLGPLFRWPGTDEVTELALPAPGRTGSPATLFWWVGGFAAGDPDPHSPGLLYLHLVASVAGPPPEDLRQIFARCLQRLGEIILGWTRVRQLQHQAHLGQLLSVVAHEVRNPLATVRASLQLGRAEASPSLRPLVDQAIREVDQTVQFMELLLRAARPQAAAPESLDLDRLVEETLQVYAGACRAQQVETRLLCPTDLPRVVASAVLLRQALGNLLRNAIEAMPRGGKLTVSLRRRGSEQVEIAVTDSGPGLSEEAQRRLFEPFYTSKPGGSGLGLAVVKHIALAHGGDVSVQSRPGEGATFTLTLPLAQGGRSLRMG
ncbi:sensor histidine kinase [Limnochorda pilosa]|uniref:histidine kinase n=1 Tax=Limnochorda pilosa TaxID=1555112 RepID=A0A0K2SP28_LIMPI|nr:ATP-binding protein [Limnochorda pilosa]BAS28747.1 histidine kinase [Limnochorda pilosa]